MPPLNPPAPRLPEFPPGASTAPGELDRREFLRLAGASLALSGLAGCDRPAKTLVPDVTAPGNVVPGVKSFYASAMNWQGYARGILVESHEGRPTKIEGNPAQAESGGATDAVTQASIRGLYDPERSRRAAKGGAAASWEEFHREWSGRLARLRSARGEGWAILTEPTTSLTLRRQLERLLADFPRARWYQFSALPSYEPEGRQADYDFGAADVILSVDSDFLAQHPAAMRYGRAFSARRRLEGGKERLNRLYQIETGRSVTGGMADVRLALAPSRLPQVLAAIAADAERSGATTKVEKAGVNRHDRESGTDGASGLAFSGDRGLETQLTAAELDFVVRVRRDLAAAGAASLCVAGSEQTFRTRQSVAAMNRRNGADGRTVKIRPAVRSDADPRAGSAAELLAELRAGKIETFCCLAANPVYASAPAAGWGDAIGKVPFSVHLGEYADETARRCTWHLPESHYLEAWGDLRGFDGSGVIQQPLIEPLHDSRSVIELLHFLAGGQFAGGDELVRATHAVSDEVWTNWLNAGHFEVESQSEGSGSGTLQAFRGPTALEPSAPAAAGEIELVLRPEPFLWDGRFAGNAWLQELPRPYTSLVWDNAVWLAPEFARRHGLQNNDVIRLTVHDAAVEAPIFIVPGVADNCAVAELGGGRSLPFGVGSSRGFSAYPLQTRVDLDPKTALRGAAASTDAAALRDPWSALARWEKVGRTYPLVTTQHHFEMEGREPVHVIAVADLAKAPPEEPIPGSLYPAHPAGAGHAWGMLIDLSACLGCSACVAACQAENNIPSVGKDAVGRGREMHWIRLDRYFGPDDRGLSQPVPCMQCENAPCEAVCPVGATVHSSEGVNEMVYNRCVGTRYCSNNCPYKVRRFNFFDLKAPPDSPLHLQENPVVTVRDRGVMEKCTYCVQRIDAGRIQAERENRPLRDGEIRTACQQVCPAEAIVFGDLSDRASAVVRRKAQKTHYSLLAELNTRPRTTYLAKVINP